MTKNVAGTAKWICIIVVAAISLCIMADRLSSQNQHATTPFTVRYVETSAIPNGPSTQSPVYWAVRGDGSVSFGSLDPQYGKRMVRNIDEKKDTVVADSLKVKTTYEYSYIPFNPPVRPARTECKPGEGLAFIGVEDVKGIQAYRYRRHTNMSNGNWEDADAWFAPALNCCVVQTKGTLHNADGTVIGTYDKTPTLISMGEPDDNLFDIPDSYVEVKPSELEKATLQQKISDREGLDAAMKHASPGSVQKLWDTLDARYNDVKDKGIADELRR